MLNRSIIQLELPFTNYTYLQSMELYRSVSATIARHANALQQYNLLHKDHFQLGLLPDAELVLIYTAPNAIPLCNYA